MWDLINDAEAAFRYIAEDTRIDQKHIYIMGHSEGAMLATILATRLPVAGLILLSGAAETLLEAMERQRRLAFAELEGKGGLKGWLFRKMRVSEKGEKQAQKIIKKMRESTTDTIRVGLQRINAKWPREHFAHDLLADLAKVRVPVLALTGEKDCQANPDCLDRLPGLSGAQAEYHVVPDMDHGLKEYTGPLSVLNFKKQYRNGASLPLHPELQALLKEWLEKHYLK